MRFSVDWLKEYVKAERPPEELAAQLTMLGVEVERVFPFSVPMPTLAAGRIESMSPHPSAKSLSLCLVNAGAEPIQVVCGAPNARPGLTAPFAPVGSTLPNGGAIRAADIRGETSYGMLCSEKELGISDDAGGLMELQDAPPGTLLSEPLGMNDIILDVSITPNRPDCLSVVGIAREIAASDRLPLITPTAQLTETGPPVEERAAVDIHDPDLCPRYAARAVLNVRVGASPMWMQRRIRSAGMRPINNIVDATNFVLMELGHPLHAFDLDLLSQNRIVVRRARQGETLLTLDGRERALSEDMLVIADAEKAVALAGIMGGAESEVSESTTDILLESAYFNPINVRRTAKALGMQTEASYRFERGADPEAALRALDRTAQLIAEIAGGTVCKGAIDCHPKPAQPVRIRLRQKRANALLGIEISTEEMRGILTRLGFQVTGEETLEAVAPTFRPDIEREVDLIEEAARVYGYDKIPVTLPSGTFSPKRNEGRALRLRVGEIMRRHGLNEAANMPWLPKDALDAVRLPDDDPRRRQIALRNPMTTEMAVLRSTLLPSLLENIARNSRRQVNRARLYELQRVFSIDKRGGGEEEPRERWTLGGVLWGDDPNRWTEPMRPLDFYDAKGVVETLFEELGIDNWRLERGVHPCFHPGRSAQVFINENPVGDLGEAHPDVMDAYGLPGRAYLFEIDMEAAAPFAQSTRQMKPLPQFPGAARDLAVVVDEEIPAEAVLRAIHNPPQESADGIVHSARLFDLYAGDGVGKGKKSLAFALFFQKSGGTLTDQEIEDAMERILQALKRELNAERRAS
ncbi:MAG: phenylalanine--tRNA ligase subunit beta [Candidatus Poribacteria bacterium]|nr:phenylalanine--tRNA ligase subunit beta [Candidatus Poribacteria bacterium]